MSSASHLLGSSRLQIKPQKSRGAAAENQSMNVREQSVMLSFYMTCHSKMKMRLLRSLVYYDMTGCCESVLMKEDERLFIYSLISDESITVAFQANRQGDRVHEGGQAERQRNQGEQTCGELTRLKSLDSVLWSLRRLTGDFVVSARGDEA